MPTRDNLVRGMIAGFAATTAISLLVVLKEVARILYGLDLVGLLSGLFDAPVWAAWLMHFFIGTVVWGALFAALAPRIPGSTCVVKGILFAVGAWLVMQLIVMPLAGQGFFGTRYTFWAPLVTLALHILYGAVLGGTFARLKGYWHVHHEHKVADWRHVSDGKAI
ncbi:MAG TPA: DUF6789 family protein [Caulobacteraceae bacterium]|nr:DUF6789 family protein [Caulobacteraceae bacterium]